MSGLITSLRRIEKAGHEETQMFGLMVNDLKQWHAQLLVDRAAFSHFKDPDFERAVIDWSFDVGRLIVVSDGIDAAAGARSAEGFDPTEDVVSWRKGLVERLAREATRGDALLEDLKGQ